MLSKLATERFKLKRYFSFASGVLMLAVALPLAYAYFRSEVNEHTQLAGSRNEVLARTYANTLWPSFGQFLLRQDLVPDVRRAHQSTQELNNYIRQISADGQVVKIKVYNLDGVAVYSSVLKEIGEDKHANPGFLAAREGQQVNDLTHRGLMSVTEGQISNVDVVSSYIPIRLSKDGPVVAVFELYSDITITLARIQEITIRLLAALIAVFLLLYLSLLAIVARADKLLSRQYVALEAYSGQLEAKTAELENEVRERKEIERALRESEELAASANRAKSEFLSGMSHELRTPMNAILGFAQLLETEPKSPLTDTQQRFVKQILKAADHLLLLINQVLDLAKIEAGKLPLSIEPVALEALLDEALPMVQHLQLQHEINDLRLDLHGLRVVADYGRLKQVLLNLITNAIKYNRRGGSIALSAVPTEGRVRIAVTDTGAGLPPERMAELFQPFNRLGVDSATIEGTGIGLALSKRLVEAMSGTIGVESTPGVGSSFWIELPAAAALTTMPPAAGAANGASIRADEPVRGARYILYIEDNPANVMLMEELVSRLDGVRLQSAHTAEIGIAMANSEVPDLIVMDINLPGMDGVQALGALRGSAVTQHVPVIALTANALEADVERGLAAGFDGYHTKPIQIAPFTRALLDALGRDKPARHG